MSSVVGTQQGSSEQRKDNAVGSSSGGEKEKAIKNTLTWLHYYQLKVIPPDSPYKYIFQYNILDCWHQKRKTKGKEEAPLKTRLSIFSVATGRRESERPDPVEATPAWPPGLNNYFSQESWKCEATTATHTNYRKHPFMVEPPNFWGFALTSK